MFRERGSSAGSGLVAANPDGFNTKPDGPFCHTLATESDGFEMRTTAVQSLELHRTDYCQVLAETCLGRANDWPRCPLFGAFGMSSSPRIQQSARIDDVVRAQLADWAEIFSCPSCPIRIGFADQIFSFSASSESAALIECVVIPSPGSASPIKLAFFAEQPATPDQTTA
ncbi:hypothetical protein AB0C86_19630 [Streptomyces lavendulae]|uniref:hypothetical protein n=1 Tax=Streptomyces lavendulae TaxID=1914 RepID=UPI0033C6402B